MQRNPDATAFMPRLSSGLNPNRSGRQHLGSSQRGTVSMPASPLLGGRRGGDIMIGGGQAGSMWPSSAQSSQDTFALPSANRELLEFTSPFDINFPFNSENRFTPPSSPPVPNFAVPPDQIPQAPAHDINIEFSNKLLNHRTAHEPPPSALDLLPGSASPLGVQFDQNGEHKDGSAIVGRRKRAQVRVACTHCQKACKKCSNTRPCERCVKYGLKDCIDSTRRPRRSGIKRGPYKRRASKYLTAQNSASANDLPTPMPNTERSQSPSHNLSSPSFRTDPEFPALLSPQLPLPYPPGPQSAPNELSQALSAGLYGPRWINGHRISDSGLSAEISPASIKDGKKPIPMYPKTPVGRFPMALGIQGDPFSRAVSPIRQFSSIMRAENQPSSAIDYGNDNNFPGPKAADPNPQARPSLFVNTDVSLPFPYSHTPSPAPPGTCSPYCIPNEIRKPSIWTLLSANSPHVPSPSPASNLNAATQYFEPVEGEESPVLFNQPMQLDGLDVEHVDYKDWSGFASTDDALWRSFNGANLNQRESEIEGERIAAGEIDVRNDREMEEMDLSRSGFEGLMGFD